MHRAILGTELAFRSAMNRERTGEANNTREHEYGDDRVLKPTVCVHNRNGAEKHCRTKQADACREKRTSPKRL
jgi:hypothetical protein